MEKSEFRPSRFTLGVKLSLLVVALVLAVSVSLAYFLVFRTTAAKRAAMERQVSSLGGMIASMRGQGYGGRQYDPALVRMFVELGFKMGTQLTFALFTDAAGRVEDGSFNVEMLGAAAPALMATLNPLPEQERLVRIATWDFADAEVRPFRVKLVGPGGEVLGWAVLGFSTREMEAELRSSLLANVTVTGSAFLIGLVGALLLARHFTRPIRTVAQAMHRVSQGELEQHLTVGRRDEIGILAESFNFMTTGLRERERIKGTFARYVSDQVAERILQEKDELVLAGELRQVTVLFLDIRGFTTLSEILGPREVVALLNDYFDIVIDVIFHYEGTINKFIGDSIMALYGAPRSIDLPEFRAALTAVQIQRSVGAFNQKRLQEGKPVVNFGIGIHAGEAIAGNIGSARRMEYTVIGRDVNLAQRIEASTREGQILISEAMYHKVAPLVEVQPKEAVMMKGILEPIQLFEVTGVKVETVAAGQALLAGGQPT